MAGDDKCVPLVTVAALEALRAAGLAHPHVVLLLEASEESSSVDLPAHLDAHGELLGRPDLILCLDTFVPDAKTLWHSSSMRGIVVADLSVTVAGQGMHSGMVGGIAPSSFRLLLDRLEVSATGACLLPELRAEVPAHHRAALVRQAGRTVPLIEGMPLLPGIRPQTVDPIDQLLAQSWSPSVAYVGVAGMPPTDAAASVLRQATTVRLSIRLPPTVGPDAAVEALTAALEVDPPAGAAVRLDVQGHKTAGPLPFRSSCARCSTRQRKPDTAAAPPNAEVDNCSATRDPRQALPDAPVVPLGLVTPTSNPHGPDENIDLDAAVRLTGSWRHSSPPMPGHETAG